MLTSPSTSTLLNTNVDPQGWSDDSALAQIRLMGSNLALVRNEPKLVSLCKSLGMTVIYRQAGDDNFSSDPTAFVQARVQAAPDADYIYLTNECGLSAELTAWTITAASAAAALGKKVVAFNVQTHQPQVVWDAGEIGIRWIIAHGDAVGVHLYLDGKLDPYGEIFFPLADQLGGDWFLTEFAPIPDVTVPQVGWQGEWNSTQYNQWLDQQTPMLQKHKLVAFIFSLDQWPIGKPNGLGTGNFPEIQQHCAVLNKAYPMTPTDLGTPEQVTVTSTASNYVNVRQETSTGSPVVGTFKLGDGLTIYPNPTPIVNGYPWIGITEPVNGWAAETVFKFVVGTPEVPVVQIPVPYEAQVSGSANHYNNDCGVACALMLLRYYLTKAGFLDPTLITVDEMAVHTALAVKDNGLTTDQIVTLMAGYGIKMSSGHNITLDQVVTKLNAGTPVIALVSYADFKPADSFTGLHFVVILGYSQNNFWCNDPYNGGPNFVVTRTALDAAMKNVTSGAAWPYEVVA